MRNIEEALKLESVDEIEKEIEARRELLKNMIGTLYPSVVSGQIHELNMKLNDLQREKL